MIWFYQNMSDLLVRHGFERAPWQTPLEFAATIGIPEVNSITAAYNRVRFGSVDLEGREKAGIENDLAALGEKLEERKG